MIPVTKAVTGSGWHPKGQAAEDMNPPWTAGWLDKCQSKLPLCSNLPPEQCKMLFLRPFIAILLAQTAVAAPAPVPAPGPLPLADHPDLGHIVHKVGRYAKMLVGLAPRDEIGDYGNYGSYGKYGSYGSYPDTGGEVNGETSNEANAEVEGELLETLTTTMPVFTTTITLRSISTPSPTITAVSTAGFL